MHIARSTAPTASAASAAYAAPAGHELPEVARARDAYRPHFGSLGTADAARAVELVGAALADLTPVVVVNRRPDVTLDFLARGPEALMDTIHTARPDGVAPATRQIARTLVERLHGTHGEGDLAGRTVFGSVRFVPRAALADARDGAAKLLAHDTGRVGVREYGQLALVLDPASIGDRTTFSARDSAKALVGAAPADRLAEVVVERLARNFGFKRDLFTGRGEYRIDAGTPTDQPPLATAARQNRLHDLLTRPRDEAVAWLRDYLQSDTFAHRDQYLEAQVRGVRARDVAAIVAEPADHADDARRFRSFDPGAPVVGDIADAVRSAASAASLVALI